MEAMLPRHFQGAEVDQRILVAGEAEYRSLPCCLASRRAACAPSLSNMRCGSSKRMTSWCWTRSMQSVCSRRNDSANWRSASFFERPSIFVIRNAHWRATLKRPAHAAFAFAFVVIPGVVHERDAAIDRPPNELQAGRLVHEAQAEMPPAKPDDRDLLTCIAERTRGTSAAMPTSLAENRDLTPRPTAGSASRTLCAPRCGRPERG
jgi:hypothetical protein